MLGLLFKMDAIRIEGKDKALELLLQETTDDDGKPHSIDKLFTILKE